MAFKIHDLLIDLLPQGDDRLGGQTCLQNTDQPSECQEPSCADCKPHSQCPTASKLQPEPDGVHAAGLPLLRQQLRAALAQAAQAIPPA